MLTDNSGKFALEKESLIKLIKEVRAMKELQDDNPKLKNLLSRAPRLPLLYDE